MTSPFANPAGETGAAADAYTRALLDLLGDRDPFEVQEATVPALRRIVDERDNLSRHVLWIVRASVERCLAGGHTAFAQLELHDGFSQSHVFHDFVHGRLVVHLAGDIRIHAHVGGIEHRHLERLIILFISDDIVVSRHWLGNKREDTEIDLLTFKRNERNTEHV